MLIKIRPLYKVRMCQDQARTRTHDTYGTITQQLTFASSHFIKFCNVTLYVVEFLEKK